jgi:uncharacterized membrane protein YhhN
MHLIPFIFGFAAVLYFLAIRVKKGGVPALIAKSAASVLFIASASAALGHNSGQHVYGILIILGLVCGLLGDIWLDLKWIYPEDKDIYLFSGFYSFFTGHLFFITAIYLHFDWNAPAVIIPFAVSLAGGFISIALEKVMKMNYGKFRLTCFLYGFILILTASSSLAAAVTTGDTVWYIMSAGGILFILSDLVLSGMYFGEGKNTPANVIINHGLYYAAQFVIASSVLYIGK